MQYLEHADARALETYPGIAITPQERDSVDNATATVKDILLGDGRLVIYGLSQSISAILTYLPEAIERQLGGEKTLRILHNCGKVLGKRNYGLFLTSRGLSGGPRAMCAYQDFVHALRGPRHATALFAKYDRRSVLVERSDCVYFYGTRGKPNRYVKAIEDGMMDGFKEADPSLVEVVNEQCLCLGHPTGCRHRFVFLGSSPLTGLLVI